MNEEEHESEVILTKYTQKLALEGELWGIFREFFATKWPRYKGSALWF